MTKRFALLYNHESHLKYVPKVDIELFTGSTDFSPVIAKTRQDVDIAGWRVVNPIVNRLRDISYKFPTASGMDAWDAPGSASRSSEW